MLVHCIRLLHLLFIAFVVLTPFLACGCWLLLHAVTCPCLLLHWWTGRHTCALTLLERHLTGRTDDAESFFHRLVTPIYSIDDYHLSTFIQLATVALWCLTLWRIWRSYASFHSNHPRAFEHPRAFVQHLFLNCIP